MVSFHALTRAVGTFICICAINDSVFAFEIRASYAPEVAALHRAVVQQVLYFYILYIGNGTCIQERQREL